MYQKVLTFVRENHMIEPGDCIIAGVSGGADSMSLLLVLERMKQELEFDLEILHVEHGIRGEESLADAEFVRRICRQKGLPFRMVQVEAQKEAKKNGQSVEEAARNLRYRVFEMAAEECEKRLGHSVKIAVAHNRNDQAETLLFHLVRGSSVNGMGGIKPARGKIIRPLLNVTRKEIEAYLKEEGQDYRTDATNTDEVYSRNKIRHSILPLMEELNSKATEHLADAAEDMQEVEQFLAEITESALECCVCWEEKNVLIKKEPYMFEKEIIRRRVLHEAIALMAGKKKDITREHIRMLVWLMEKQPGKKVVLPYGIVARRIYEGVELSCTTEEKKIEKDRNQELTFRVFEAMDNLELPKKKYTKWFDYDKIRSNMQVRTRQSGDYLVIDEKGRKQKLKNFFINNKIPQKERDEITLLCDGNHVIWIVGYRISSFYKVTDDTKNIVEVQFNGGNEK